MPEQINKNLLLGDPLAEVTRRERRMLLGVSLLGVVLVKTGLIPTKISALGVEFDKTDQQALLNILAFVTLYFLVAFVIYATSDFLAWRRSLLTYHVERMRENARLRRELKPEHLEQEQAILWELDRSTLLFSMIRPVSTVRALFEFVLPIVFGVYAIILL
jgi:hypothetical protein